MNDSDLVVSKAVLEGVVGYQICRKIESAIRHVELAAKKARSPDWYVEVSPYIKRIVAEECPDASEAVQERYVEFYKKFLKQCLAEVPSDYPNRKSRRKASK